MEVEWDRGLWGCYVCYADKSHLTDQTNTRTDNDDHIHAHNHHGNASYTLGHNPYSHLTLDEFHARFKLGASRLLLICVFCMHRPPYVQRIHIHSAKKPLPHHPSKHAHTHMQAAMPPASTGATRTRSRSLRVRWPTARRTTLRSPSRYGGW